MIQMPVDRQSQMVIGTYITRDKNFTNVSRTISPSEILSMDIGSINQTAFLDMFSNNNYEANGECVYIGEEVADNHDDYDECDDYEDDYYNKNYDDEPYAAGDPRYDRN